jgi:hypothetical protein
MTRHAMEMMLEVRLQSAFLLHLRPQTACGKKQNLGLEKLSTVTTPSRNQR